MEFEVGGKKYTQAEVMSMPAEEFAALQKQWVVEQEEADAQRSAVIPAPEPEAPVMVEYRFRLPVLCNKASEERLVERSRLEVKRILDRSLHRDVDVWTHRESFISVDDIAAMEGRMFDDGVMDPPVPPHTPDVDPPIMYPRSGFDVV